MNQRRKYGWTWPGPRVLPRKHENSSGPSVPSDIDALVTDRNGVPARDGAAAHGDAPLLRELHKLEAEPDIPTSSQSCYPPMCAATPALRDGTHVPGHGPIDPTPTTTRPTSPGESRAHLAHLALRRLQPSRMESSAFGATLPPQMPARAGTGPEPNSGPAEVRPWMMRPPHQGFLASPVDCVCTLVTTIASLSSIPHSPPAAETPVNFLSSPMPCSPHI